MICLFSDNLERLHFDQYEILAFQLNTQKNAKACPDEYDR